MTIRKKNVLITGASRGIGHHIAHAIARCGGNVALLALPSDAKRLQCLEARLTQLGITARSFVADISDSQQINKAIKDVAEQFGAIDIFISNAGIESMGVFELQSEQTIEKTVAVNLLAPMLITRKLLPQMLANESGHIVAISSFAGKMGLPYQAVYSATKAGLIKWALGMKREFANSGVSFSVISPTYVSRAGMYADILHMTSEVLTTPKIAGEVTPRQVARAVVCSIVNDKTDLVVGSPLLRFASVVNEFIPDIVSGMLRFLGILRYNKKLAFIHRKN